MEYVHGTIRGRHDCEQLNPLIVLIRFGPLNRVFPFT